MRLHREAGHQMGVVLALMQIGYIHICAGEAEQAAYWFTRCADVCRDSGNAWYHGYAQWGLAVADAAARRSRRRPPPGVLGAAHHPLHG